MNALTCPKCGSEMRGYERNRVHVDQCTGCGGLFLDRGELETLVAAENAWNQPPTTAQQAPYRAASKPPYGQYGDGRRKKSFLSELFD